MITQMVTLLVAISMIYHFEYCNLIYRFQVGIRLVLWFTACAVFCGCGYLQGLYTKEVGKTSYGIGYLI